MKKFIRILLFVLVLSSLTACGEREVLETIPYEQGTSKTLNKVENIKFAENVLSFDAVENAVSYEVEIYKNDKLISSTTIGKTSLDLSSYYLYGSYTIKVKALRGIDSSEASVKEITLLAKVSDVVLEAEEGLLDYTLYKGNELAHGNAYIGNIDNCGQGVYYNYFCYAAGTYEFEAHYLTEVVGSKHDVFVNGVYADTFDYQENTGWGTASELNSSTASVMIELKLGWNTISVIKNGNSEDNYGGFAELDYFVVKSNGSLYNPLDYQGNPNSIVPTYRLEAELGCSLKREETDEGYEYLNNNTDNVPIPLNGSSLGYLRGNYNTAGEGIEWRFSCDKSGKYQVKVAYTAANNEGAQIYFYNSNETFRDMLVSSNDLLEKYHQNVLNLDNGLGWDQVIVNSETIVLELTEGTNFIYAIREESGDFGYFQIDYIELIYMGE